MSVKIRLRRTGRKKQPSYRIVVADSRSPRDGAYLDNVGTYNPTVNPAELRIDLGKVDSWVAKGAGMSETVASLVRKARRGGDAKVALRPIAGGADPGPAFPLSAEAGTPEAGASEAGASEAGAADEPAAAEVEGGAHAPAAEPAEA
jgi:small subunit ribosomal protein S16